MLDIITMVFNLLRSYFPAEFRWSILMDIYDMFAFNACMCTIVYCMFYALRYVWLSSHPLESIVRLLLGRFSIVVLPTLV